MRRAGFWTGAGTLSGAVRQLLATPGLWGYAVVPVVTLVSLTTIGLVLLTWLGVPHVLDGLVTTESQRWYARLGSAALATLLWLVGCASVLVVSWVTTPLLCAPALEAIVRRVEATLGVPTHPALSFWRSFSCGLRAQLMGLATLIPIGFGLWLMGVLVPFTLPLIVPLHLIAVALSLAWSLLDYPLTLRGMPARQRLQLIRRHWSAVLGFGLAFGCLFWIPLAAVLLLPLGVIAATRLVWRISPTSESEPSEGQVDGLNARN